MIELRKSSSLYEPCASATMITVPGAKKSSKLPFFKEQSEVVPMVLATETLEVWPLFNQKRLCFLLTMVVHQKFRENGFSTGRCSTHVNYLWIQSGRKLWYPRMLSTASAFCGKPPFSCDVVSLLSMGCTWENSELGDNSVKNQIAHTERDGWAGLMLWMGGYIMSINGVVLFY